MTKLTNSQQTLQGRVKLDLIPNVSDFQTFIKSYSELAALFGLKSPSRQNTITQFEELNKANKYLVKQYKRAMKYAQEGRMQEHDYLTNILLTKSEALLVMGIHHKCDHWYQKKWSKVVSLINKTKRISKGDCKLNSKRVWIDKKPGDYARPLSAPKMEWRIQGFQINRMIEHVLTVTKKLTPWQHGGRSFKGTHTAWEKIMFVLRDKPFIYEFDLKGFYDNIKTERVAPFLGEKLAARVQEIVNTTTPTEYVMPPLDKDIAHLQNEEIVRVSQEPYNLPDFVDESYSQTLRAFDFIEDHLDENLTIEEIMSKFHEKEETRLDMVSSNRYAHLMNGEPTMNAFEFFESESFKEEEREKGRDMWKGLAQEGKGFPQGLSFSPILSTNLLERALPDLTEDNLTMYMDDGLIYGDTKEEVVQIINKIEQALEKLGIAFAPEKSGWVRENWKFIKSSKFLAIRIREDGTLVSETRKGTSRPFPTVLTEDDYKEFCEGLDINPSMSRIAYKEIYEPKGKEYAIWLGNVMGNILNHMYAPEADKNSQEFKIWEGKMKAIEKILDTRHLTLQKLEKYFPEPITRPGLGERMEAVRLTSVSSIAAIRLLRYLRMKKRNRRVRA